MSILFGFITLVNVRYVMHFCIGLVEVGFIVPFSPI